MECSICGRPLYPIMGRLCCSTCTPQKDLLAKNIAIITRMLSQFNPVESISISEQQSLHYFLEPLFQAKIQNQNLFATLYFDQVGNLPRAFLKAESKDLRSLKCMLLYIRQFNAKRYQISGDFLIEIQFSKYAIPSGAVDFSLSHKTNFPASAQRALLSFPINLYQCRFDDFEPFFCAGVLTTAHMEYDEQLASVRASWILSEIFDLSKHRSAFPVLSRSGSRVDSSPNSPSPVSDSPSLSPFSSVGASSSSSLSSFGSSPTRSASSVPDLLTNKKILIDLRFLLSGWDNKIFRNHINIMHAECSRVNIQYVPLILNIPSTNIALSGLISKVTKTVSPETWRLAVDGFRIGYNSLVEFFASFMSPHRSLFSNPAAIRNVSKVFNYWNQLMKLFLQPSAQYGLNLAPSILAITLILQRQLGYPFELLAGCATAKDRTVVILAVSAAIIPLFEKYIYDTAQLDRVNPVDRPDFMTLFTHDWSLNWNILHDDDKNIVKTRFNTEFLGYINLWSVGYDANKAIPLLQEGFLKHAFKDPNFYTTEMAARLKALDTMGARV